MKTPERGGSDLRVATPGHRGPKPAPTRGSDLRVATHSASGLTLVEVIISMAILAVVIMGTLATITSSMRLDNFWQERSSAMNAARTQIENVESTPYANIAATYNGLKFTVQGLAKKDGDASVGLMTVTSPTPTLLEITARVDWTGIMGDSSLEIRTQVAGE